MSKAISLSLAAAIVVSGGGAAARLATTQGTSSRAEVAAAHESVAIIVNNENKLSELPIGELRRMLIGEVTRWPDGRKITIAMRESGQPERDAVLRLVCRMNDQDFTRYLLQAAYRGELQGGPKLLDTSMGVRRFVFNVPGAIGYVRGDEVDGSVKVLRIGGTVPEEPAFGLTLRAR